LPPFLDERSHFSAFWGEEGWSEFFMYDRLLLDVEYDKECVRRLLFQK